MLNQLVLKLIKDLKEKSKEEVYSFLMNENSINNQEKWLVYSYLHPRIILDKQLPGIIQEYRKGYNSMAGFLFPDIGESSIIVEAYKTQQYGRFIRHIIHSFAKNPEKVNPLAGKETCNCCLCDKNIYGFDLWNEYCDKYNNEDEKEKMEYLSFISTDSGLNICKDCLIQLINADQILEQIEPGYLDLSKKFSPNC